LCCRFDLFLVAAVVHGEAERLGSCILGLSHRCKWQSRQPMLAGIAACSLESACSPLLAHSCLQQLLLLLPLASIW
jgi:hypothetical protein